MGFLWKAWAWQAENDFFDTQGLYREKPIYLIIIDSVVSFLSKGIKWQGGKNFRLRDSRFITESLT